MKKVAIPIHDNLLSTHFGNCEHYAIFETKDKKIVKEYNLTPPPHEPGVIPVWLHQQGVTDIIAGGIGQRAIEILIDNNINVYYGVTPKPSKLLIMELLGGTLESGVNLCDH